MYSFSILINFLLFIVVSIILLSLGSKILKIFGAKFQSEIVFFIFSFALGYGIFGYLLYLIGLAHLFYFWLIWILLILILIISFREFIFWLETFKNKITKCSFSGLLKHKFLFLLLILVSIWLIFIFISAVSPMVDFDSRWYHFGEAKYYLENHKISIDTFWAGTRTPSIFWPSAFPRLAEIMFAVFLSFKAEIAAKLLNFAFGLIGIMAIFAYVRKKCGSQAGLIAAISILVSAPFITNSFIGYIDLIVFGFSAVSFLAIFNWLENNNFFYLILAAIFSGFVISCKLNGLFILPIFILIIFAHDLLFKRNIQRLFKDLLLYMVITFIFSFVWYLDNKLHTGSFIYPFDHLQQELGLSENFLLKIIRTFLENVIFIFPLLILFIFGFSRKYLRVSILLFLSFLIYFVLFARSPANEPRYLMPGIFGLVILAGMGFEHLINYNRVLNYAVKVFVVAVILVNLIQRSAQVKSYFPYFIGLKTRHQFLTQAIASDWWSVYDYNGGIKKTIGSSKAILAGNADVTNSAQTYYVDFNAVHASLSGINFFEIKSAEELANKIKGAGFDYIIIKRGNFGDLLVRTSIPSQKVNASAGNPNYNNYFVKVYNDPYALISIYKIK